MGHRDLLVTHNYLSQQSGLPTSPTRQRPPRQRLRSDGQPGRPYASRKEDSSVAEVNSWRMELTIEKISAVTLRVANMTESVQFYRDVLGMELLYGGEDAGFSSLRAKDG